MSGGPTGNTLREAYGSPANAPAELLRLVFPGCNPRPAADGSGVMCDPRGGEYAERSASFTFWRGQDDGGGMFSRKGTGETFNALTLLARYGNGGVGMPEKDAAALLISRAGLERQDAEQKGAGQGFSKPPARLSLGVTLRQKQGQDYAPEPEAALKGWEPIPPELPEGVESSPARDTVAGWGLLPAVPELLEVFQTMNRKQRREFARGVSRDAVALKIRGPEGETVAVKFRNPGTAEDLKAAGLLRYKYPAGHKGMPAHCSPGLTSPNVTAEVWTEGEKNGAALMLALKSRDLLGVVGVQGTASAGANPHVRHNLTGRRVFVWADSDKAGTLARVRWARLASELGAVPYMLPAFPDGQDAADYLAAHGAEALASWLTGHMDTLSAWQDPEPPAAPASEFGEGFEVWPYKVEGGQVGKLSPDKDEPGAFKFRPLLGFSARVVSEETRERGDGEPVRLFAIEGQTPEGRRLPPLEVPVKSFGTLGWALEGWGADGFVYPGSNTKDEARAALLTLSRAAGMSRRTVFEHTGWVQIPEHGPVFLSAGACIGAAGVVPGVGVSLSGKLSAYHFPEPPEGSAEAEAVRASLDLLTLGPASLMVPLLGMVYRAPLGAVRFSGWLESRTGWGKSAVARILLTHYGADWLEQFPGADLQSTGNALTLNTDRAHDVFFVADDFKPEGTRAEVDKAHGELSRFLSAAGNGAGRDRMDFQNMKVRTGLYPRGLVLVTAESSPRKHSDIARTVSLVMREAVAGPEAPQGWRERFNQAERLAASEVYASALSGFIRWIAEHYADVTGAELLRRVRTSAELFPGSHARTSNNSAELFEGWRAFLTYARECGAVTDAEGENLGKLVADTLRDTSAEQGEALGTADPVNRFLTLLSGLLRSGAVYIRDAETGEVPGGITGADNPDAPALGWRWRNMGTAEDGEAQGYWEVNRNAVPVGYLGEYGGRAFLLLEPSVYAEVNKAAEREGYALPTPKALWRQMADRFRASGEMVTETGKATYRRTVYGSASGERIPLYNISWPFPENNRDNRDITENNAIDTASKGVPIIFLKSGQNINNRDTAPDYVSDTVSNGVPFSSSADSPEQDGENVPGELLRDDVEVFTV